MRITSDLHFSPFVNSCQKLRQKVWFFYQSCPV
nr:MAG TPA: hypothetical protein [Caudoviricetes sp.]